MSLLKLYKTILIGYIIQIVAFLSLFFTDCSDEFYIYAVMWLWVLLFLLTIAQWYIFKKVFKRYYDSAENFRQIQNSNGADLPEYISGLVGVRKRFYTDLKYSKRIHIPFCELNYMRRFLKLPDISGYIEFVMILLIFLMKLVIRNL